MVKHASIILILCSATLQAGTVSALAQVETHPRATVVACPATATVSLAVPPAVPHGWASVSNTSADFVKAEVENAIGLGGSMLTCSYSLGAGAMAEIGRLSQPEPVGMLCTVNAIKNSQFDCFPRPGADLAHPAAPGPH
jgi:hypothetical protein